MLGLTDWCGEKENSFAEASSKTDEMVGERTVESNRKGSELV